MFNRVRTSVVGAFAAALVLVGAPAVAAPVHVYVNVGTVTKAHAYVESGTGRLCIDLLAGNMATVSLNGTIINDFTAGDGISCPDYAALQKGVRYRMNLSWRSNGGEVRSEGEYVTGT